MGFGDRRIAENIGMVSRIDAIKAARRHGARITVTVADIILPGRGRDAENADNGGDGKRDESLLSSHGRLLLCQCGV
jgi:hypothetical protein